MRQTDFPQEQLAGSPLRLRLLATSDLHAAIRAYDYFGDRPAEGGSLTRLATLIRAARTEAEDGNTLLFDNGDLLQGNLPGDYTAQAAPTVNPIIEALNALDTDAATLGNHDFNFGLDYLEGALQSAAYPVVCANIVRRRGPTPDLDTPFVPPFALLRRRMRDETGALHDLCIGVLGLIPPQTVTWEGGKLDGALESRDVLEAARAHLPRLRAAGADVIVVLAHGGLGVDQRVEGPENLCLALARMGGIDALVMGHVHGVFPESGPARMRPHPEVDPGLGTVAGIPAVMPGMQGSHLGVIDLRLAHDPKTGRWRVTGSRSEARPVAARDGTGAFHPLVTEDPAIETLTRPLHEATLDHMRQTVTRTARPLVSYFTMIGCDPALETVTGAMRSFLREHLRGTAFDGLPVLAAAAPMKAGELGGPDHFTDVPAGAVALRDLSDIYPFPDRLHALLLTGAELHAWLEVTARAYNRIKPGSRDAELLDGRIPGYARDTIDGLNYRIDLSRPQGRQGEGRVMDLTCNGRPVQDNDRFVMAVNNHRASGGRSLPGTGPGRSVMRFATPIPEIVRAYLDSDPHPAPRPSWGFAPLRDTTVLFRTGPGAERHLGLLHGRRVEPRGTDPDGFRLYSLNLDDRP
jgi:2',3'-cyclic-nucleotide 2'-phosphodiesterase/3'-nucleotidase